MDVITWYNKTARTLAGNDIKLSLAVSLIIRPNPALNNIVHNVYEREYYHTVSADDWQRLSEIRPIICLKSNIITLN